MYDRYVRTHNYIQVAHIYQRLPLTLTQALARFSEVINLPTPNELEALCSTEGTEEPLQQQQELLLSFSMRRLPAVPGTAEALGTAVAPQCNSVVEYFKCLQVRSV
jgi:hypothetical protein